MENGGLRVGRWGKFNLGSIDLHLSACGSQIADRRLGGRPGRTNHSVYAPDMD